MGSKLEDLHLKHKSFFNLIALLQSPFLLAIRLFFGWKFFQAGIAKFHDIPGTAAYFEKMHVQMPTIIAFLAAFIQYFGGLCLIFGLASRVASFFLSALMTTICFALYRHELAVGNFHQIPIATFLMATYMILLFGTGKLSFDHIISWTFSAISKPGAPKPGGAH